MGNSCDHPNSITSKFSNLYFSGVTLGSHSNSTMAREFGCDPTHPSIARQKVYQDLAFQSLNLALSIDETSLDLSSKAAAIPHYQAGIQSLIAGVSLPLPTDNTDQGLARAHKLRSKMMANLQTAQERLTYLTTTLHLNNLSLQAVEARSSEDLTTKQPKVGIRRSNTFTKDDKKQTTSRVNTAPPAKLRIADSPVTVSGRSKNASSPVTPTGRGKNASSPVSSPTRSPRNNRAAELRLKTNNNSTSKGRPVNSSTTPSRKVSDRDSLKKACQVIKGCDGKLVEMILNEVVPKGATGVSWADVSGQEKAKSALHEMVVLPTLRPELFTGLREPARGLLLFGPPGNGKTLLAKALAAEASSNLINISSSSLTSKWLGEGEKMVKALFSVARHVQPSIIFIDEIDALLSERRSGEHEGVRRIKTEFLLQFEGMTTGQQERVVVVAATNRPQELDDAALRRFTKRVYVRMPDGDTRRQLVTQLLSKHGSPLTSKEIARVVTMTEGYTCSDLTNLARDAALAPVREISTAQLATIQPQDIRHIQLQDFIKSSERGRKSLSTECMQSFEKWNTAFGDIS
eukprot:GFUD01036531.1.p1 GENE.GFUD01036531.1~~GFUD01036531.1.p1  ORF type:complete len:574 (+),score=222.58 GFUD01036531.1:126-1847(+)